MDFSGKRVLVTGGTRGIGRGIVEGFLEAGARVAVNGTSTESVATAIEALGPGAVAAPGSVASVAGCLETVNQARESLGGLDVLVNNAGASSQRTAIDDVDEAHWHRVVDTNLKGTYFCIKFALPALRESRGNVVNISSTWGIKGQPFASTYCASKAGVVNLTKALALELAPDVRVNCVLPGAIETDMLRRSASLMAGDTDSGLAAISKEVPIGRIGAPRDIANGVLYLACESLASFVTGAIHEVDGGDAASGTMTRSGTIGRGR